MRIAAVPKTLVWGGQSSTTTSTAGSKCSETRGGRQNPRLKSGGWSLYISNNQPPPSVAVSIRVARVSNLIRLRSM